MNLLGQAEVHHLDVALLGEHDVSGFQVAVNDTLLVSLFQRLGDLAGYFNRSLRQQGCSCELRPEGFARDALHYDPSSAIDLGYLVDLADVGMVKGRRRSSFSVEALERPTVIRCPVSQELDGNLSAELGVVGEEHLSHATLAQAVEQLIARGVRHVHLSLCGEVTIRAEHADADSDPQALPGG